jgi:hypothetical protein
LPEIRKNNGVFLTISGGFMYLGSAQMSSLSVTGNTSPARKDNESGLARKIINTVNAAIQPRSVYAAPSVSGSYGFSYMDSFGLNKKYVSGETRLVKATDTPFESDIINHLTGGRKVGKVKVTETTSAVEVPMKGVDGMTYLVRSDFVHYRGSGGQVTIMPNGDVDTSDHQHIRRNMLPGMERKTGEFAVYEIPEEKMLQTKRGTFSSFSLSKGQAG